MSAKRGFFTRVDTIDALRAIAILGVIFNHILHLQGGFTGVDVFFVISGYVITLSALNSRDNDVFSVLMFFYHRTKRIIPPLFVVSVFIFLIGRYVLISENEYVFLKESYLHQAFFAHNFYFAARGVEYFHGLAEAKLNLHLWSIAVEEQFYLIFPLFFWAFSSQKTLRNFAIVSFLVIILSLASIGNLFNIPGAIRQLFSWEIAGRELNVSSTQSIYYLLYPRIWQLLLGCLGCVISYHLQHVLVKNSRISKIVNSQTMVLWNLVLIVASFILIRPNGVWPNFYAVIPTFATLSLLIQFHLGSHRAIELATRNPFILYIGRSSYSIYLYHWPIFAALLYTNSTFGRDVLDYVIYLAILVVFSHISYVYVEKSRKYLNYYSASMLLVLFIGFHYYASTTQHISRELQSANIKQIVATSEMSGGCNSYCTENPTSDFIVLYGDSHALVLAEPVAKFAEINNLQMVFIEMMPLKDTPNTMAGDARGRILKLTKLPSFKGMIVASRWSFYLRHLDDDVDESGTRYLNYSGGAPSSQSEARIAFKEKLNGFLTDFSDVPMVVLRQVPRLLFPPVKEAIVEELGLALRTQPDREFSAHEAEQAWANKLLDDGLGSLDNAKIIDPADVLCNATTCIWRDGLNMYYRDDDHLSLLGVKKIMPMLEDAIYSVFMQPKQ